MTRYLLSVCYPADRLPPAPEELSRIATDTERVHDAMVVAGVWVFGGALHDPGTATVVTVRGGDVLITDGPFVETKEQIGGFSVIEVPDLDAALRWGEQVSLATTCPIEVRPFQDVSTE
ncbi:YciI family protein [Egicoccus sp. AB-alg2]|uniref:YciI family protein n=1 Tax=Egicoccus sp. AB-alg2 TaxID=3242693 RepID=UPI00359EA255